MSSLFQTKRPRRLRLQESTRCLVRGHQVTRNNLIAPIFVSTAESSRTEISSLPNVFRIPLHELADETKRLWDLGLMGIMLFPVNDPSVKDLAGKESYNPSGLIQKAIETCKKAVPEMTVFADVALDPFTTHGHDGILSAKGEILNDETVEVLCKMSVTLANAGVNFVAPSDMMDGRVGAIRQALDSKDFWRTGILAYSAKFASAFYGPFREAVQSGAAGLDKRTYQLEVNNRNQALLEARLDEEEGADMIMVKPALPYMDIIRDVSQNTLLPVVSYHVSGEYCMLKAASQKGWLDEKKCVSEVLTSLHRAGSQLIVTYYASWACENDLI
jgi:porphobilinogen synthase